MSGELNKQGRSFRWQQGGTGLMKAVGCDEGVVQQHQSCTKNLKNLARYFNKLKQKTSCRSVHEASKW